MLGSQPGQPGAGPALPSSGPARTLGPAHLELSAQRWGPLPSPPPAGPPSPAAPRTLHRRSGSAGPRCPPQASPTAGWGQNWNQENWNQEKDREPVPTGCCSPLSCYGVSVWTPPAPCRTLCDKSRWCRAVPAVGAAPARPCPCQSPGEAVPASAALTQLNPAQQHEMETRHPECQLWSKGKAGFRSLGVSFGPLSYSSSQPTLCHTRGTTALGSGRPWG